MRFLLSLLAALCTQSLSAEPLDALGERLAPLQALQGRFEQRVLSPDGELLESSSGRFMLLRPGLFYWRIEMPDEQLLVAADDHLWHYDADLATATRRALGNDLQGGPLAILSGKVAQLADHYYVRDLGSGRFRLEPRAEDREFEAVELSFSDTVPLSMTVEDRLQQTTRIRFEAVELNPPLERDDFRFEPPDGVDVFYHD
jgi:outer membrane lipoprotein carrier protein